MGRVPLMEIHMYQGMTRGSPSPPRLGSCLAGSPAAPALVVARRVRECRLCRLHSARTFMEGWRVPRGRARGLFLAEGSQLKRRTALPPAVSLRTLGAGPHNPGRVEGSALGFSRSESNGSGAGRRGAETACSGDSCRAGAAVGPHGRFTVWPRARSSWSACGKRASGGGKTTFGVSTAPMALRSSRERGISWFGIPIIQIWLPPLPDMES